MATRPSMPHRTNPIAPVSCVREIAALAAPMMAEDGIRTMVSLQSARQPANWVPPGADSLPTNAEIEAELRAWQAIYQDEEHAERLVEMRRAAIEVMRLLAEFRPYLTGAVLDGTAGRYSEVDIEIYRERQRTSAHLLSQPRPALRAPRTASRGCRQAVLVATGTSADPGFDLRAQCRPSLAARHRTHPPAGRQKRFSSHNRKRPHETLHQTLLVIAVAAGAGAGYLFNHSMSASADRTAQPGSYISSAAGAKDFALGVDRHRRRKVVASGQWRGKIMVVNFTGNLVPPCRKEIPGFSRQSAFREQRGTIRRRQHRYATGKRRPLPENYGVPLSTLIGGTGSLHFASEIGNAAMGLAVS